MLEATTVSMLLSSVLYSALGVVVFGIAFWVVTKVVPFSVRKEIEQDQNVALGIILGALILGIAIIIAAAIHG